MSLSSYTYIQGNNPDPVIVYEVYKMIDKWKRLFYKVNRSKDRGDEAMSQTLLGALKFYKPEKGNLQGYIVQYAKTVLNDNTAKQEVLLDFLELVLGDGEDSLEDTTSDTKSLNNNVPHTRIKDFTEDLFDFEEEMTEGIPEVSLLALSSLQEFVSLATSIQRRDTTNHYTKQFMNRSLDLSRRFKNFNSICVDIYNQHKKEIEWFLKIQTEFEVTNKSFEEADYTYKLSKPKRINLINADEGTPVKDADTENFVVTNKNNTPCKIYKINYIDTLSELYDYATDEENNEFSFHLSKHWLFRSLHSNVLINPKLDIIYEMLKVEIITNLIKATKTKFLHLGSDCLYLVKDRNIDDEVPTELQFNIKNYNLMFIVEEIKVNEV